MDTVINLVKEFGLPVALLIFFIWQVYSNNKALAKRLTKIEDYQRDKLENLVVASTDAINRCADIQGRLIDAFNMRPCINNTIKPDTRHGLEPVGGGD